MELLAQFGFLTDLVAIGGDIPPAITVGWLVFVVWSIAQVLWYRRARVLAPLPPPARTTPSRPREVRRHISSLHSGSPEFLAGLGLDPQPGPGVMHASSDPHSQNASGMLNVSATTHGRHATHAKDSAYS